jgi:hypothetical protein
MAEIFTASVEHTTPSLPQWLRGAPQSPWAIALAAAIMALVFWSFGPDSGGVVADTAQGEMEATQTVELSREWQWRRESTSFDSMYRAGH